MRQKHARPLPVSRLFSINLWIIIANIVIALTQYFGQPKTQPTSAPTSSQAPIPASTVPSQAASGSTPSADASSTGPLPTSTVLATPAAATPAHTPTDLAMPTAAILIPTPTVLTAPTLTAYAPTPRPIISTSWPITQVLGLSTLGWPIETHQFGDGPIGLAFVGGIHGGYEWNSILLAYEAIDHFTAQAEQIPDSISLYIIPSANPDGQVRVLDHVGRFTSAEVPADTFPGRFNGNGVDLNRNWDQDWTPVGTWRDQEVSGGEAPFSEVETQILRDFLRVMDAVVFWHSARPGVYVAFCDDWYPPSQALAAVYAKAARYPLYEGFYDYAVTGNATDWLACAGVPAIAVELTNHTDTDGARNLAAIQAVVDEYGSSGATRTSDESKDYR